MQDTRGEIVAKHIPEEKRMNIQDIQATPPTK